jgi:hypothetical protein
MPQTQPLIEHPLDDSIVRGAIELEPTEHGLTPHRLPAWARAQAADPQIAMAEAQPSGVRLAFTTEATTVEIDVLPTRLSFEGAPPWPAGVYDLTVDGRLVAQQTAKDATLLTIDITTGAMSTKGGAVDTLTFGDLPAGSKRVEIWLPHMEMTELVALRTDRPIEALPSGDRPVWVHYGSSISQGSNADHPLGAWAMVAASLGGVDLVNMGFSGSALLDPFVARTMRDVPADLLSMKVGINIVNTDLMRLRAFRPAVHGFLDTLRDGHPDTPLVLMSPVYCALHENTPGPGAFDMDALAKGTVLFRATGDPSEVATGKLTLTVIRQALADIAKERAVQDPNLYYLDGLDLYGQVDYDELPLADALHPSTAAHSRIGERFAARVFDEWRLASVSCSPAVKLGQDSQGELKVG